LIITNTEFVSNTTVVVGGGAAALGGAVIQGGRFERNSSAYPEINPLYGGGGLYADGALTLSGTQFISNKSTSIGGAVFLGSEDYKVRRFINALFTDNAADADGSAIAINAPGQHELLHLTIASSIFITKPAIAVYSGTVGITNSIVVSHSLVFSISGGSVYEDYNLFFGHVVNNIVGITSGGHSLIGDPRFVDPFNDNFHLQFGSAAIDHGVDAGVYTDLDGSPRPVGTGFDIGAYEYAAITYRAFLPVVLK
jgi:hypothetical protein